MCRRYPPGARKLMQVTSAHKYMRGVPAGALKEKGANEPRTTATTSGAAMCGIECDMYRIYDSCTSTCDMYKNHIFCTYVVRLRTTVEDADRFEDKGERAWACSRHRLIVFHSIFCKKRASANCIHTTKSLWEPGGALLRAGNSLCMCSVAASSIQHLNAVRCN